MGAKGAPGRPVRPTGGFAGLGDAAGGRGAGNWSETFVSAVVPTASSFKGNSGKDFSRRDMITKAQKSAAPEIRHANREVESRVNKFAQNLHVL